MLEIHPCVKLNLISLWDGPRSTIGSRWNVNLTVDPNIELNGRINVRTFPQRTLFVSLIFDRVQDRET